MSRTHYETLEVGDRVSSEDDQGIRLGTIVEIRNPPGGGPTLFDVSWDDEQEGAVDRGYFRFIFRKIPKGSRGYPSAGGSR